MFIVVVIAFLLKFFIDLVNLAGFQNEITLNHSLYASSESTVAFPTAHSVFSCLSFNLA